MGGGKLPPRQKMIGMMYLVLTALLAMNVSKDILNAFVVVNESLTHTNHNFEEKNNLTYAAFDKAMKDPKSQAKAAPYNKMALEVKKRSEEINEYIEKLKVHVIMKVEGCPEDSAKRWSEDLMAVSNKDNYDVPSHELIGEGLENPLPASTPNSAAELQKKIEEYRDAILAIFNDTKKFEYNKNVKADMTKRVGLVLKDGVENGVPTSWAGINFYHLPLAAVITNLTKVQADIRNAEAEAVNEIYKGVEGSDFKFDKLVAKVIAPSSYIVQGGEYKASVLLVAFNSTSNPEIVTGDVDTSNADPEKNPMKGAETKMEVLGGQGVYSKAASSEGIQKWGGCIKVPLPGGAGFKYYPFQADYMVAKPSVSVAPDKMNVFYIGVPNPVTVSAAGIPADQLIVTMNGGSISVDKKTGKGTVNCTTQGKATISVSAKIGTATKNLGTSEFRVKRIPDPVAKVLGKSEGALTKGELKAAGAVLAKLEGFDFEAKATVKSFTFSAVIAGDFKEFNVTGGNFTPEVLSAIDKARGKVLFENVKASMPDGTTRTLPTVVFKVK